MHMLNDYPIYISLYSLNIVPYNIYEYLKEGNLIGIYIGNNFISVTYSYLY